MLKKLKSLFIVEDGKPAKSEEIKPANKVESQQPSTPTAPASNIRADAKSSSKFVDVLLKAIEANNMDGFDYLEYKQSLQNLSKMAMDEQTRYQSAFAMAKTMGVTPAKLQESANHYLKVLLNEETKFQQALQNQRTKQISEREKAVAQLENLIVQKQKQIEKMKAELIKHNKELETKKKSIATAAQKVEKTKINFESAYNSVVNQIKDDLEKMKQYLK